MHINLESVKVIKMNKSIELKTAAVLGVIGGLLATITGPFHPFGSVSDGKEIDTTVHMKEIAEADI